MFSEITVDKGAGPKIDSALHEEIKVWQSKLSEENWYKISSNCL